MGVKLSSIADDTGCEIIPTYLDARFLTLNMPTSNLSKISDALGTACTHEELNHAVLISLENGHTTFEDIQYFISKHRECVRDRVKDKISSRDPINLESLSFKKYALAVSRDEYQRYFSSKDTFHVISHECMEDLDRFEFYSHNKELIDSILFRSDRKEYDQKLLHVGNKFGIYSSRQIDAIYSVLSRNGFSDEEIVQSVRKQGKEILSEINIRNIVSPSNIRYLNKVKTYLVEKASLHIKQVDVALSVISKKHKVLSDDYSKIYSIVAGYSDHDLQRLKEVVLSYFKK